MAYVSLSRQLRSDIRGAIIGMRNKEMRALGSVPDVRESLNHSFIEDRLWDRYAHLRATTPPEWMREVTNVAIAVLDKKGNRFWGGYMSGTFTAPPAGPRDIVLAHDYSQTTLAMVEHNEQQQEVSARWDNIHNSVETFLNSCKSLNEALKLMPELSHYVPPYYLDKVREKRGAAEAASAVQAVDRDALIAGVVAARLAGGGS